MRPNIVTVGRRPHMLGVNYGALVSSAPGIAASVGTPAAVAAAGGAATAAGAAVSVAVPVAGIVIGAIIAGLFAAHAKRVAGAKQENQVLNSLIPTVIQAISQVFDNANSGAISADDAIQGLAQIQQSYWQAVQQVESGPGQAGGPNKCPSYSDNVNATAACDRSCTASCCIGCDTINKWIYRATRMFQTGTDIVRKNRGSGGAGGGTNGWDYIVGNKYGLQNFSVPNWQYTPPPPPPPGSVAALTSAIPGVSAVTADLASLPGGSTLAMSFLGVPVWMLLAGFVAYKVLR